MTGYGGGSPRSPGTPSVLRPVFISLACIALAVVPGVTLFSPWRQEKTVHEYNQQQLDQSGRSQGGDGSGGNSDGPRSCPPPFQKSCEHLEEVCLDQVRFVLYALQHLQSTVLHLVLLQLRLALRNNPLATAALPPGPLCPRCTHPCNADLSAGSHHSVFIQIQASEGRQWASPGPASAEAGPAAKLLFLHRPRHGGWQC